MRRYWFMRSPPLFCRWTTGAGPCGLFILLSEMNAMGGLGYLHSNVLARFVWVSYAALR